MPVTTLQGSTSGNHSQQLNQTSTSRLVIDLVTELGHMVLVVDYDASKMDVAAKKVKILKHGFFSTESAQF